MCDEQERALKTRLAQTLHDLRARLHVLEWEAFKGHPNVPVPLPATVLGDLVLKSWVQRSALQVIETSVAERRQSAFDRRSYYR